MNRGDLEGFDRHPSDDHRDEALVAALRRIVATVDAPPPGVLVAARAAFLARHLDGEIAVLIADSRDAADATGYQPVRSDVDSGEGHWLLSFRGGGVQVDMEIAEEHGQLSLIGQFSGTAGDDFVLETAGERRRLDVDSLGRFVVDGVGHGPIRLRCRSSDGTRVTTAWVTV